MIGVASRARSFPRAASVCGALRARSSASACRARCAPIRAPLCARCGAPTAWPVERCLECSGRRLAFASARAAVVYAGPARAVRAARGRRAVSARSRPSPPSSSPSACPGRRQTSSRISRPTATGASGAATTRREALARELGRRWELEVAPLLARTRARRAPDRAPARRAPAERPRRVRGRRPGARARSCSSTTSTRPERRRRLRRRRSGGPVRQRRRVTPAPAPCANARRFRLEDAVHRRTRRCAMRLQVKGTEHRGLSPTIREYAESKLARLDKQLRRRRPPSRSSSPRRRSTRSTRPRRNGLREGPDAPCQRVDRRPARPRSTSSSTNLERQIVSVPREAPPRADGAAQRTTALEPLSAGASRCTCGSRVKAGSTLDGRGRTSTAPPALGRSRASTGSTGPRVGHRDDRRGAGARRRPRHVRLALGRRARGRRRGHRRSSRSRRRSSGAPAAVPGRGGPPRRRRSGPSRPARSRSSRLPDVEGDEIELSSHDGERTLVVDGEPRSARSRRSSGPSTSSGPAGSTATLGGRGPPALTPRRRCVGQGRRPADTL